ncbi:MAG: hypothetical protein CMI17_03590 [Opitutaceae bacterium]|nr:hypothetical protein [Opitutaceae bacterium]|tara:strand:- start:3223 stop:3552 length:330 start_codon:yes stop_codon:yes gene_type:complete
MKNKIERRAYIKNSAAAGIVLSATPAIENNSFPGDRRATLLTNQHHSETKPIAQCVVIVAKALLQLNLRIPTALAKALAYIIISNTMTLYRANRPEIIQTCLKLIPNST